MKSIKWLISLADGKPLLYVNALLLITIAFLVSHVLRLQDKADNSILREIQVKAENDKRLDSIRLYYIKRESELESEVKANLNLIIEDYRRQLQEQKDINWDINNAINRNQKLLKIADRKLKNLQ